MSVVLGYWNIRGVAQPVRLMLTHAGVDFEDKQYETGPAPGYNRDSWLKDKHNLNLDFPGLPYLIDGDLKITQTNAIMRHVARKHGLDGSDEASRVRVDVMENVLTDFRNASVRLFYNPMFEKLKKNYLSELVVKLKQFEKQLGDNKFLIGDKITFVDFVLYELLDQHRVLDEGCLRSFPKLAAFMKTIEELPSMKTYMASDKYLKAPINNKNGYFSTGKDSETTEKAEDEK